MERYQNVKLIQNYRIDFIVLILFLLFGGFLRLWNLSVPSFWVDEVNTVFAADSLTKTGSPTLPSGMIYDRAFLHTYTVALFYHFFGVSETTTRLPSAIFGLFSIIMAYFVGREIFSRKVGLLSAFFVTFSHFEVGWSRTARMYILLQFIVLFIVYCFVKGFENKKWERRKTQLPEERLTFFTKIGSFLKMNGLSIPWLLVCLILIWISTFYVHLLTLFLLFGILLYLFSMALVTLFREEGIRKILNKYVITSLFGVLVAIGMWIFLPKLREMTRYFLSYTPPWAAGPSSAQRKLRLFEFLISPDRFPFAAFFFLGGVQIITRRNKLGWILLWEFIAPLFLLTFIFTHRVPTYLFYVYPFFLMIAAFSFVNLLESETSIMAKDSFLRHKLIKGGLLSLFFLIFILSPWFRITLHIPFFGDGVTNMAVTPDEWKEATRIVRKRVKDGDLIISSLPQVALYYKVHSDYGLNWSNLKQAKEKEFRNKDGRWVDVYAGVKCIESLNELKSLLKTYPRGWLLVTKYHLEHVIITPPEVRKFIEENLGKPYKTKRGTVLIYHWNNLS